jgi:hypothetical protein
MSNTSGKGMLIMPECSRLWSGTLAIEQSANRVEWLSTDIYRGVAANFRLLFDESRVEWEEGGFINMEARRVTTGYQFYEPTHGQGATNHIFEAIGTIADKKVSGRLGFNAHFQRPGINYRISPMTKGGQLLMWLDVSNVFKDGSWEQGPIIVGRDGFSVVWIVNDKGQTTYSFDVDAEFDLDADLFATETRFRYFDARSGQPMQWVWRPKPGSNMSELPALAPHLRYKRAAEGSCVRAGETGSLRHTSAWPEYQVDERLQGYFDEKRKNGAAGFF